MAARDGYELESITFLSIRGFESTTLDLSRQNTVLVGPNNSGKSSLLRILDWVMNDADESLFRAGRTLSPAERQLLIPARPSAGVHRITLRVLVPDQRHARRFGATDHYVDLRIRFFASRVTIRTGPPERAETSESTDLGMEFLRNVRAIFNVLYIDARRDASAEAFSELVLGIIVPHLTATFLPGAVGGRPTQVQQELKKAVERIEAASRKELPAFWDRVKTWLPGSMESTTGFDLEVGLSTIIEVVAAQALPRLATGLHDANQVSLQEIGAGHQSLIYMAMMLSALPPATRNRVNLVMIEEPESFLHPSAQRELIRRLYDDKSLRLLITTHSPVLVDEAVATDVVLVRDHCVFSLEEPDKRRVAINTALLTGQGSEAVFSRSLLLVEGPGDRAFFERLRRRLFGILPSQVLGAMGIVAVGGKTRFGPWISLLQGYRDSTSGTLPIAWRVVADGGDAVSDVFKAITDAGLSVPADARKAGSAMPKLPAKAINSSLDIAAVLAGVAVINIASQRVSLPLSLLPVDLEYAALSAVPDRLAASLSSRLNAQSGALSVSATTTGELMSILGSKGGTSSAKDTGKADWMRDFIATELPWPEMSSDIKNLLWQWASGAAGSLAMTISRPAQLR